MDKKAIIIPTLCVALFYIARGLVVCLVILDPVYREHTFTYKGLWHLLGSSLLCLFLLCGSGLLKRLRPDGSGAGGKETARSSTGQARTLRLLSHILAALMLASGLVIMFTYAAHTGPGAPAVPYALLMTVYAFFWPVLVTFFFSAVPTGRQGLCLGCGIAAGELLWLVLLPTLGLLPLSAMPVDAHVAHLRRFFGLSLGVLGILLAWAALKFPQYFFIGQKTARDNQKNKDRMWGVKLLFAGTFAASVIFLIIFGIGTGLEFPKSRHFPLVPGHLHYLLLFSTPMAGAFLDGFFFGKRRGLVVVASSAALIAFCIPVVMLLPPGTHAGVMETMLPVFLIGREMVSAALLLLAVWIGSLLWPRSRLPLIGTAAYLAYHGMLFGVWLIRNPLNQEARAGAVAAVVLAGAFTLLVGVMLWKVRNVPEWQARIRQKLHGGNTFRIPGRNGAPAGQDGDKEQPEKFRLFCLAFSLTKRETEVLYSLIGGMDIDVVCKQLSISERTVRFHLGGALKKTSMPNRQRLLLFYELWKPGASGG